MNEPHIEIELNPDEARLYDRIRLLVVRHAPGARAGLPDVLMLLPDVAVLLARLLRDSRVSVGDKAIALLGLGYLLSPIDLLPAWLFGPLGVLDDLVVLCAAASRVLNHVHPDVVRANWSGSGDALAKIREITAWSERELGGRVRKALGSRRD